MCLGRDAGSWRGVSRPPDSSPPPPGGAERVPGNPPPPAPRRAAGGLGPAVPPQPHHRLSVPVAYGARRDADPQRGGRRRTPRRGRALRLEEVHARTHLGEDAGVVVQNAHLHLDRRPPAVGGGAPPANPAAQPGIRVTAARGPGPLAPTD